MHAQPSSGAWCLIFGWPFRLLSYFMCANSEGSGETARMRRLTWAFAGRLCGSYLTVLLDPAHFVGFVLPQLICFFMFFFKGRQSCMLQFLGRGCLLELIWYFRKKNLHKRYTFTVFSLTIAPAVNGLSSASNSAFSNCWQKLWHSYWSISRAMPRWSLKGV